MSSIYRGASARDKLIKEARSSDHWGARQAAATPPTFARGESVRVKKTRQVAEVTGMGRIGYTLRGLKGEFPPHTIEKV